MSKDSGTVKRHEIEGLNQRLGWLDEERSKLLAQTARMQQIIEKQERTLSEQQIKIDTLENRLMDMSGTRARISQMDTMLEQFKDEVVGMIDQYDQRQKMSIDETNRLRRIENEVTNRGLSELRGEIHELGRLNTEMELRQVEESRLANLLGTIQSRMTLLENRLDNSERQVSFIGESEQQRSKMLADSEANISEIKRRVDNSLGQVELYSSKVLKVETGIKDLTDAHSGINQRIKEWSDQIQLGEYERNQKLETVQGTLKEFQTRMDQFAVEWSKFSEQYRTAQSAVNTLESWKEQMSTHIREMSESNRLEANRMQTRWDNFLAETEKRWRNVQVDIDQNSGIYERQQKVFADQVAELQILAKQLESERDALWRVQDAQLDAIKQLPRLWLEEVEKARQRDPNRRREPSLVSINEETY